MYKIVFLLRFIFGNHIFHRKNTHCIRPEDHFYNAVAPAETAGLSHYFYRLFLQLGPATLLSHFANITTASWPPFLNFECNFSFMYGKTRAFPISQYFPAENIFRYFKFNILFTSSGLFCSERNERLFLFPFCIKPFLKRVYKILAKSFPRFLYLWYFFYESTIIFFVRILYNASFI